ncbi:MAG: adenylate kinase [Chloroflexi bacterium]|nr:adenylate kinase [Chloroflexota bacterium]
MKLILLGAPGAGKGTQAERLSRRLGLAHVASGDLFRQAQDRGTQLGLLAKRYMEKGMLVPDEITIKMIEERISAPDCKRGFILDGFPRTVNQAKALDSAMEKRGADIDKVLYIEVSSEELVRRLSGRWICRACQTPYHILSSPPKMAGKCDRCGGELYQRPDDSEETARKRLDVYFSQTTPLIEYYRTQGKLAEVDGQGNIGRVERDLLGVIEGVQTGGR